MLLLLVFAQVVRAGRKIESKQMGEKEAHAWMLGRLKSIRLLTDRILEELYAKCM